MEVAKIVSYMEYWSIMTQGNVSCIILRKTPKKDFSSAVRYEGPLNLFFSKNKKSPNSSIHSLSVKKIPIQKVSFPFYLQCILVCLKFFWGFPYQFEQTSWSAIFWLAYLVTGSLDHSSSITSYNLIDYLKNI